MSYQPPQKSRLQTPWPFAQPHANMSQRTSSASTTVAPVYTKAGVSVRCTAHDMCAKAWQLRQPSSRSFAHTSLADYCREPRRLRELREGGSDDVEASTQQLLVCRVWEALWRTRKASGGQSVPASALQCTLCDPYQDTLILVLHKPGRQQELLASPNRSNPRLVRAVVCFDGAELGIVFLQGHQRRASGDWLAQRQQSQLLPWRHSLGTHAAFSVRERQCRLSWWSATTRRLPCVSGERAGEKCTANKGKAGTTNPRVGFGALLDRGSQVCSTAQGLHSDSTLGRNCRESLCLVQRELRANLLALTSHRVLLLWQQASWGWLV